MPSFTIETTYRLPVFRQHTYVADSVEAACRLALDDEDWSDGKEDYETPRPTYVTGIWPGANTAYQGEPIPVPLELGGADRSEPVAAGTVPSSPISRDMRGEILSAILDMLASYIVNAYPNNVNLKDVDPELGGIRADIEDMLARHKEEVSQPPAFEPRRQFTVEVEYRSDGDTYAVERFVVLADSWKTARREALRLSEDGFYVDLRIPGFSRVAIDRPELGDTDEP